MWSRLHVTYGSRALVYAAAAVIGSALGSMLTWRSDVWVDASLWNSWWAGLFSLGPAVLVLAAAVVSRRLVWVLGGLVAGSMVLMWWAFASNESSTSALVFLLGWFIGVPLAGAVALVAARFRPEPAPIDHGRRPFDL